MRELAFDFETSYAYIMGYDSRAYPVSLSIFFENELKTWIFNHNEASPQPLDEMLEEIKYYFEQADILIAHNIKFDLHWLRRLGIDYSKHKLYCSQVAEYLIQGENNRVRYSLAETSKRYGIPEKQDVVKDWWDAGYETCEIPLRILIPYAEQDTLNTFALYQKQQEIIRQKGLEKIVALSCEMGRLLNDIEWEGMKIDIEKCEEYCNDYGKQIEKLYEELSIFVRTYIFELCDLPPLDNQGKIIPNFGSGEQLSAILFGGIFKYKGKVPGKREGTTKNGEVQIQTRGLGLSPRKGTETSKDGYFQTDAAQLDGLKVNNKTQRIFIEQLRELSRLEKMKGTYFGGMLRHQIDGYVHGNVHQTRTVTGRFSMTDPALQTIPRGSTSPVKQVFVSRYE